MLAVSFCKRNKILFWKFIGHLNLNFQTIVSNNALFFKMPGVTTLFCCDKGVRCYADVKKCCSDAGRSSCDVCICGRYMMINDSLWIICDVNVQCTRSFFFLFFFIFCDKCDSPFFVYLSKEKLMMQRQKMFPFVFWSFLQATKEKWRGCRSFLLPYQFFMNVRKTQTCPICKAGS